MDLNQSDSEYILGAGPDRFLAQSAQ